MNTMMRSLSLSLAVLLAACGGDATPDTGEPPLAGARIGAPFALTDGRGRTVRDTDFAGKYRIVYFGYTFCPDVCPVDMQTIAAGLRTATKVDPKLADKIVPIFITIDPERDGPKVVGQYVAAFGPNFVGLSGTPEQIARVAKGYGVYYAKRPQSGGADYLMDHSRQAYLMGPNGEPVALLPNDETPQAVAAQLSRWVR